MGSGAVAGEDATDALEKNDTTVQLICTSCLVSKRKESE